MTRSDPPRRGARRRAGPEVAEPGGGDDELKSRVEAVQDRRFALMTRAGNAAVAMIDAIVAVRKPHDDRHREAATARARETLGKK